MQVRCRCAAAMVLPCKGTAVAVAGGLLTGIVFRRCTRTSAKRSPDPVLAHPPPTHPASLSCPYALSLKQHACRQASKAGRQASCCYCQGDKLLPCTGTPIALAGYVLTGIVLRRYTRTSAQRIQGPCSPPLLPPTLPRCAVPMLCCQGLCAANLCVVWPEVILIL